MFRAVHEAAYRKARREDQKWGTLLSMIDTHSPLRGKREPLKPSHWFPYLDPPKTDAERAAELPGKISQALGVNHDG
jgi:hypothetical protein